MNIAYGPPGQVGVKSLQYLSGDGVPNPPSSRARVARAVGLGALGVSLWTKSSNKNLSGKAAWVAFTAFVVEFLS